MTVPERDAAEDPGSRLRFPAIALFTSHWLAMVGLTLVLTSIVLWICLLTVRLRGGQENPYIGLAMMGAGGLLAMGAVIAPIGLYFGRRRLRTRVVAIDKQSAWVRLCVFLLVVSALNLGIVSQSALKAVHHMESKQFCLSCHVHLPEERAFDQGPHAGILCVDCHVGEGTLGLIESKIQGTEQLMAMLTDSVKVPVETAIERGLMIPSAETCETCHWKGQPATARLRLFQKYAEDEGNTPETTLMTMFTGGELSGGIHGSHYGKGIRIRFRAVDPARQDIPWVEYSNPTTGETRAFTRKGADAASYEALPVIEMQCFDCHNRPAHAFLMPDRAVDKSLMLGRMSSSLPFLKKTAVEVLKAEYATGAAAETAIPAALAAYYAKEHPKVAAARAADIEEAGRVIADIYSRNVFPELGVKWGTYPDNRGHQSFPGCFRCHGGEHSTPTGETITNNCFRCHFPAAVGEAESEMLQMLGVDTKLRALEKK